MPDETTAPATLAIEERGEIALVLEGDTYVLRPSYEAIESFETATGKGLVQLSREAIEGRLRLGETAQIAAECIRAWGRAKNRPSVAGVNAVRIAELIIESEAGVIGASRTLATMLAMAATGGYTAQGEAKAGTMTTTAEVPAAS
ncbi:MAG: GTA-gp10 family protein [Burkholderiaceae bacterium]